MVGLTMSASDSARSTILGRIRDAVGAAREPVGDDYARIERRYIQSPAATRADCLALFVDRLAHYQVGVQRVSPGDLPAAIAATLAARGKSSLVVPADIDRGWLPGTSTFLPDQALAYSALDASEGVLTGCSLGIAVTGTIVLRHGPGEGRRVLTLIPDYHLCVVLAEQVVETVPEAIRWLAAACPALVTTISGPSATADIEMTRIRGVHGPRTVDVVIVDNAAE
jgi:L-lactate dehydrogenase complex protein LldG